MKIRVLNPYRGVSTNEALIDRGLYEDGQIASNVITEMVELGFAVIEDVQEPIQEVVIPEVGEQPVKARRRIGK